MLTALNKFSEYGPSKANLPRHVRLPPSKTVTSTARRYRIEGAAARIADPSELRRSDQIREATPISFGEKKAEADQFGDPRSFPLRLPAGLLSRGR
jgi:hypothetical protein